MPSSIDHREGSTLGLTASDRSVAAMVLIIKVVVLAFGALAFQVANGERVRTLTHLLSIWNRWDGPQYLLIAQHGYGAAGDQRLALAFFPLYPWLIRVVAMVVRDAVLSAFLVSTVASVAAGVALARLFAIDYPRHLARGAVWFLFIFPTSYFLHIDYSESLFLALVATSFLAARHERWMAAGVLGALAVLTHDNGILLVPALVAEALSQLWRTRRFEWRWLWIGLVPLGFVIYLLVNYKATGDPLAFLDMERVHWSNMLTAPWRGIRVTFEIARNWDPNRSAMIGTQVLFFLAMGLAGTIASALLLRASYTIWMGFNWLLFACQSWDISAPRLTLAMFPLFLLIAMLARRRHWNTAITVWSLMCLALFISEFVRDHWAF
ncbi:MAG: glycosyltransferase family 39 protein [Candidatus Binataceae bacterium]